MVELDKVKTIKDCYECATVDAYGDDEVAMGWLACLDDILDNVDECECLGDIVKFNGVIHKGLTAFASVSKNRKTAFVSLDSIKLLDPTKVQKLWIKAYIKYQNI